MVAVATNYEREGRHFWSRQQFTIRDYQERLAALWKILGYTIILHKLLLAISDTILFTKKMSLRYKVYNYKKHKERKPSIA